MAATSYKYTPLDESLHQIRLLTLFPGTKTSPLRGSLAITEFTSDHTPQFEALSYAWGPTENPFSIQLGDTVEESVPITQNLSLALLCLRHKKGLWHKNKPRVLWIDAICVNQQDLEERSSQVKRMADIYKKAQRVVVWLGPASEDSSMAISLFNTIAPQVNMDWDSHTMSSTPGSKSKKVWGDVDSDTQFSEAQLKAMLNFLNRSWWQRLWIWQEIKLGSSPLVMVGSETIAWSSIQKAVAFLRMKLPHNSAFDKCLHVAFTLCNPLKFSFLTLVNATRFSLCSEPKDRIFALLSQLDEDREFVAKVEPDYTKSASEVYRDFFKIQIMASRKLQPLAGAEISRHLEGSPSWVPNWSIPRSSQSIGRVNAASNTLGPATFREGDDVLRVCGVAVGTVSRISPFNLSDSSPNHVVFDLQRVTSSLGLLDGFTSGTKDIRCFCRAVSNSELSGSFYPTHTSYLSLEQIEEILCKLLNDSDGNGIELEPKIVGALVGIARNCLDRSLFLTREGNVGIGPLGMKTGDIVTVLLGLETAMILRPVGENQYQVVGESYCDGFMDGEALLGPLPGKFEFVSRRERGTHYYAFIDRETGFVICEDPRLGELPPGWERMKHENEELFTGFVNEETGEELWGSDPRLTPELLKERGVGLRDFDLV